MTPPTPPRLRLRELGPADADGLFADFWFPLYLRAFPPEERGTEAAVRANLARPDRRLFVGVDAATDAPVALARLDIARIPRMAPFAHLVNLATDDSRRGSGLGSEMLRLVEAYAAHKWEAEWVVLEAESPRVVAGLRPDDLEGVSLARRRLGFYERHGYGALAGVRYLLTFDEPAPDAPRPGEPLELLLLARSLAPGAPTLPPEAVYEGTRALWGEDAVTTTGAFALVAPTTMATP